jgi:hypothetical protein
MSKQIESNSLAAFPPAVQAFWNCGAPSVDSAVKNYTAWVSDFSRLQNEALRFLNVRLSEDYQAAAHLAACKGPTEAFDFQVEYAGKVVSELMTESKKMIELCGQLATSGAPKQP